MKVIIALFCVILLQFIFHCTFAQNTELQFHKIDGPDGKPIGKIRNITQDTHGYMWFSGEGTNCIYRYDGTTIIAYKHDQSNPNSLGGVFISEVYADDNGIIWIGMNEGLDRFDPATGVFQHFRHDPNDPESLSGRVNPVLMDSKGRLWVGTNNGLDMLDEKTGKFIHYRTDPGDPKTLSSNFVWNMYEDHQGTIWIATGIPFDSNKDQEDGGLNRLEPDGTFTRFKHDPDDPHSLISNKVRAMFEDSRGIFWVGTKGDGLHTMNRETGKFERYLYDPSVPDKLSRPPLKADNQFIYDNDQVTFIQEDAMGSIWIGTMWSGINRYDTLTKKITHYEASNGFPDLSGWNAYQSRDGVLWISTQENNLYRVDPFFRTIKSTPTPNPPWSIKEDAENLWIGTEGGLLQYDLQGRLLRQFKHNPSDNTSLFDPSNGILSMAYDQGDTIWLGTSDGPGFFNKATKQFSRLPISIKYDPNSWKNVPDVMKDSKGIIWFVLNGNGLLRYNPRDHSFKQYLSDKKDTTSLTSDAVVSIFEDKSGKIWVGDYAGGLNRLDRANDTFKHYMKPIPCYQLFEDSGGMLWMGTAAGLYRYHPKVDKFLPFFDAESYASGLNIINLNEDEKGNLWMHNASELIRVNRATKETYVYSNKFGITENSLIPLGFYKNRKGEFSLNHQKGYYTFYPEDLTVKVYPLEIIMTGFFINRLPVLSGSESVLKKPVEEINALELAYNQNNISFNFAAIDYRSPERIKYFTRLDGYDSTWREVKGEKSVSYFSLPIGKFVFRVKAYNLDGTVGEKAIDIYILPPWWQTLWAVTSYVLFLGVTVWYASKWRARNLQRQNKLLEEKVNLRTETLNKSLNELKATQAQLVQSEKMASLGELTAGIAHEIQNPLNFVNNFSEVSNELIDEMNSELEKGDINEAKAIAKDVKQNLEKINHHGKRADAIVKGMLQHSRSSSGQKELTDINSLCDEYLRLSYHGLRAKDKSFNAKFETHLDPTLPTVNVVPQDIGRVILNLINNAFYAVSERSNNQQRTTTNESYEPMVTVSTKNLGDTIQISVTDNGPGIPDSIKEKSFQPFFTTKPTGQGTGLGLSLSYDIVKAHRGKLKIVTKENEGSEFIIQLPLA